MADLGNKWAFNMTKNKKQKNKKKKKKKNKNDIMWVGDVMRGNDSHSHVGKI